MTRKLKVFLCHASQDKPAVRELYKRLAAEAWIEPWLDEENLLPGQDFDVEIYKAIRNADAILICLSKASVTKESYLNKEIRRALDIADEKPEGMIYIIPLRLDDCNPSFERLKQLHYADYFTSNAHERLLRSLLGRANALKIEISETKNKSLSDTKPVVSQKDIDPDLCQFIRIPSTKEVPYSWYIGKYPVTNMQYERFLNAQDFTYAAYWLELPKFNEACEPIGDCGKDGLEWLQKQLKETRSRILLPRYWDDESFGRINHNHPVVGISWYEASAYCEWLLRNWPALLESDVNDSMRPQKIRLPLETEWAIAAGGVSEEKRYPWDEIGKLTGSLKEIVQHANIKDSGVGRTTPVNTYPTGKSPYGVLDLAGNVWEWQANYHRKEFFGQKILSLRGGSWNSDMHFAYASFRNLNYSYKRNNFVGFRVVIIPKE